MVVPDAMTFQLYTQHEWFITAAIPWTLHSLRAICFSPVGPRFRGRNLEIARS